MISIVVNMSKSRHLLATVRDVRTHGGEPFHNRENLAYLFVPGLIDDLPLMRQILHTFLRRPVRIYLRLD